MTSGCYSGLLTTEGRLIARFMLQPEDDQQFTVDQGEDETITFHCAGAKYEVPLNEVKLMRAMAQEIAMLVPLEDVRTPAVAFHGVLEEIILKAEKRLKRLQKPVGRLN